jgi:LPS-assembly protein
MARRLLAVAVLGAAAFPWPQTASAQLGAITGGAKGSTAAPIDRNQPVAFTADNFEYNRETGIVTATGHVEAWQNDHVLRADKITFDRNTNVAAASGNVVMVEPDGQVLFADYAEVTQGMREGVLRGMRALLAENGKLAANGARRVDGKVNELTHAVYTTCDLCKTDPTKPPLWQLRAITATQDLENHRIEYHDATLDFMGLPAAYFPYFSHPDPSVKRASGFLVPSFGQASHIGEFLSTPYFWAIDPNQDVTITPMLTTGEGEQLSAEYRRRFNNGTLRAELGTAIDQGQPEAYVFSKGQFNYDDTWRYGFDINYSSSTTYLRDFKIQNNSNMYTVLNNSAYIEGFGVGSYAKLNVSAFQGLATTINQSQLPYVLPHYEYSYFSEPDALGGRLRFTTQDFNILREVGNNTQRAGGSVDWQRPFSGDLGEQYKITIHADMAAYNASDLTQQPTYGTRTSITTGQAQPTVAAEMRWPFMRDGGVTGTQLIEPIVQLVAAPNAGNFLGRNMPNEDSFDYEFTDSTLFSLNRFSGIDRFDGGLRANVGLHTNWKIGNTTIDSLVGQSYREHLDNSVPIGLGLDHHMSDIVARATIIPASWFDMTARSRVSPRNGNINFAEAIASAGVPLLRVSAGYMYSSTNPYGLFQQSPTTQLPTGYPASYFIPRDEVSLQASTQFDRYKLSAYARKDLTTGKLSGVGMHGTYEDECFIFDVNFYRRYTSFDNDNGGTTLLFQITLKTVGQFGFSG